ncbi:hypothetical protein B0T22DRAFT_532556 [Podospora appendiculata]|uniref:Beta-lactamase-related domain-containing protein n=1 Tax=Podospora appendiculata TaxID=314037 RepID=A0AAE0XGX1_9PEZI|nr:hypothetical protein B0T22DRAFT_532556 [Podospora appendiculata]
MSSFRSILALLSTIAIAHGQSGTSIQSCTCSGLDYTNGGSYLIDGTLNSNFTFTSVFNGCFDSIITPILVSPEGYGYDCQPVETQPDDFAQASQCGIAYSQMKSGTWIIIFQAPDFDFTVQRQFNLTVGAANTVVVTRLLMGNKVTPTVYLGVTSTLPPSIPLLPLASNLGASYSGSATNIHLVISTIPVHIKLQTLVFKWPMDMEPSTHSHSYKPSPHSNGPSLDPCRQQPASCLDSHHHSSGETNHSGGNNPTYHYNNQKAHNNKRPSGHPSWYADYNKETPSKQLSSWHHNNHSKTTNVEPAAELAVVVDFPGLHPGGGARIHPLHVVVAAVASSQPRLGKEGDPRHLMGVVVEGVSHRREPPVRHVSVHNPVEGAEAQVLEVVVANLQVKRQPSTRPLLIETPNPLTEIDLYTTTTTFIPPVQTVCSAEDTTTLYYQGPAQTNYEITYVTYYTWATVWVGQTQYTTSTDFNAMTRCWQGDDSSLTRPDIQLQMLVSTIEPILSLLRVLPANEEFTAGNFRHKCNYCNECFALAGAIIERTTGVSWASFVREKILDPLGMDRTFAAVTEEESLGKSVTFSKSHSARVESTLEALRSHSSRQAPAFRDILRFLQSEAFVAPEPVEVSPSQASWASNTGAPTHMGAAAGIMSCTRDLLKLYKFIEVHHKRADGESGGDCRQLTEVERGMAAMQESIEARDPSCTYASGWNRVLVPSSLTGDGLWSRWPGAHGDNAPRVEKAVDEYYNRDKTRPGWTASTTGQAWLSTMGQHGRGTSFCFLIPESDVAVVVLCNIRGFYIDAANLTCMLIADILFGFDLGGRSNGTRLARAYINESCRSTRAMAPLIAAQYLSELVRYESRLANEYEIADPVQYATFVGTYQLTDGIFAVVSQGKTLLEFQLYGKGFKYPCGSRSKSH